jgi:hypothetical protein
MLPCVGCCEAIGAEAAACSTTKGDQVDCQARHLNSLAVCPALGWAQMYSHKLAAFQQPAAAAAARDLVRLLLPLHCQRGCRCRRGTRSMWVLRKPGWSLFGCIARACSPLLKAAVTAALEQRARVGGDVLHAHCGSHGSTCSSCHVNRPYGLAAARCQLAS